MKAFVTMVALAALVALGACSDADETRRTLKSAGYSNIQTTGWSAFSCGKDDTYSTGFVATNPSGQRVEGVVCCGLVFKGCTIRF